MEPLNITAIGNYNIRGKDYIVSLECKGNDTMTVQVEDRLLSDQWRSPFDAQYVEDLTRKTGNFKQFAIFVSMLESAISKTSESVSLDLLTYNDLEALRQKKSGNSSSMKQPVPSFRTNHLTSKRYLILTYTVEFDRIHYPLPLLYAGRPDPQVLQEEIRSLKAEVQRVKQSQPPGESKGDKLLRDYRRLEREKNDLEQEFSTFRREVRLTTGSSAIQDMRALRAMVRSLEEQLMKEKTQHQRATHKRSQEYRDLLEEVEELRASERNLRVRVKSLTSELALYKRGRPLTRRSSKEKSSPVDRLATTHNPSSSSRQRSLSNDRISGRSGSGSRLHSGSRERPPYIRRSNSTEQISRSSVNGSGLRGRSNSSDRNNSAGRSRLSAGLGSNRSRTPSPGFLQSMANSSPSSQHMANSSPSSQRMANSSPSSQRMANSSPSSQRMANSSPSSQRMANSSPSSQRMANSSPSSQASRRFNPTAFIKEKERKQKETNCKINRQHRANHSGLSSRSKQSGNSSRHSGYSYRGSQENSLQTEGNISDGYGSDGSYTSRARLKNIGAPEERTKSSTYKGSSAWNARADKNRPPSGKSSNHTPDFAFRKTKSKMDLVPGIENGDDEDSEYLDRSAEISEIDERLDRLQQLMKATMP